MSGDHHHDGGESGHLDPHLPFSGIPNDKSNPKNVSNTIKSINGFFSFTTSMALLLGTLAGSLAMLSVPFPALLPLVIGIAGFTAAIVAIDCVLYTAGWVLNSFPNFFKEILPGDEKRPVVKKEKLVAASESVKTEQKANTPTPTCHLPNFQTCATQNSQAL